MDEFDLSADLPRPGHTLLLEASAGTGKTWTIAALVARYVAEGVVPLSEMLVVTFTRAASQELRQRVRQRLREVEQALADPSAADPDDALLTLLLAGLDEAGREQRRHRVAEALADFDAAAILTIHQFCQLVLKGLGIAGDTDPQATLVEDLDDRLVEVVDDLYLRDYAQQEAPPFTRKQALALARKAVGDPRTRLEPASVDPQSPAGERVRFCHAVRAEIDVRKRRTGVLSYDDLLGQLADALESADAPARQRMRERWSVVLIDEFQDTDPVQWQVFDRAFRGHAALVLIGDPKQAIYAFRGGDVFTYLQARGQADTTATLPKNWRTDQPLLDATHVVLEGAQLGHRDIVVHPVRGACPGSRLTGVGDLPPFRVRALSREDAGVGSSDLVPAARAAQLLATDVAAEVKHLLTRGAEFDGQPLEPRHVAVLAYARRHLQLVRDALLAAGVPAVVSGGESVFRSPAATEWLTLLEALEQPHLARKVRAAALTSFFGRRADELVTDPDGVTETTGTTLREWATLLHDRGVAAVFETAVARHDLVARVLGTVGGERLLTDLQHLAQLLHRVGVEQRLGLVALRAWLHEQASDDVEEVASERTRKLDSDAEAVQLVTFHGSKGLEYPVVFLPFVSDRFSGFTQEVLLYHDDEGHRVLDVGGKPDKAARSASADEELSESLRTLYVAMTRAQSHLTAWWAPTKNASTAPLHRMLCGRTPGEGEPKRTLAAPSDAWVAERLDLWQSSGGPVWEAARPTPTDDTPLPGSTTPLQARRFTRRVDTDWRRTSYTALSTPRREEGLTVTAMVGSEPEYGPKDDEPELLTDTIPGASAAASDDAGGEPGPPGGPAPLPSPLDGFPAGAQFGSLVHAVLEHTDPAAPEHGGDLETALRAVTGEQLRRWPVDLDPDALAAALVQVHDSPLGPLAGGVTLRTLAMRDRMCELDFELPLGGGDLAGGPGSGARLRDVAPLLHRHLPEGDPVRGWASSLDDPDLGRQELRGYLAGSVDVVMRVPGPDGPRFLVVDYKTNRLGDFERPLTSADYDRAALAAAMGHSSYPLQALLYAVVLHRFLRWRLPGYDPARHLGGVLYLYVRGMCGPDTPLEDGHPAGVFSWQPPTALVTELSDLLDGPATGRTR